MDAGPLSDFFYYTKGLVYDAHELIYCAADISYHLFKQKDILMERRKIKAESIHKMF